MSKIWKLGWRDLLKGTVTTLLAVLFALPVTELVKYVPFLNHPLVVLGLSALFGYLAKNLATDENNQILGKF